jgi:hypothetical protein
MGILLMFFSYSDGLSPELDARPELSQLVPTSLDENVT